ncbi:MAG: OB-fold nucleic acid binding domain-containing protein [Candidatus Bathyarchaeia archaeon]
MSIEQMIEQILSKHSAISRQELMERLEHRKQKTGGFITDEVLLRMVAAELGVNVQGNGVLKPALFVADLVPNLSNVTVVGRVVAVFAPKTFNGSRSGKLASFLIADKTGLLRVVLWNDKTRLVESGEIRLGQVVRVAHGYTKEGLGGKVEVHVGSKAEVETELGGVAEDDFPTISRFTTKIAKIASSGKVNLEGAVEAVGAASTFVRPDSSEGKLLRFVLVDDSGRIPVVAWNEKVDELSCLLAGCSGLRLVEAKVRKGLNEGLEVHVDSGTFVEPFNVAGACRG